MVYIDLFVYVPMPCKCASLCACRQMITPPKNLLLREKTPESLLRELLAIYNGEVKSLTFFMRELQ